MSGLTHSEQESHPMLKQRTIALVAGIAAAGMLTTAAWAGGGHRHGGMGHHRGAQMFEMMDSFDTDGDGKLTQAEIDQARKDRLAKHDADKDGKLTLQEYEALWLEAMRERMVRQFQRHDRDGDAAVTAEEFVQTTGRLALARARRATWAPLARCRRDWVSSRVARFRICRRHARSSRRTTPTG
jgi:hypothetical protein